MMVKYPSLDVHQCKVYMSKAELPEAQVLKALSSPVPHGLASATIVRWDSQLIEAVFQRVQWKTLLLPE